MLYSISIEVEDALIILSAPILWYHSLSVDDVANFLKEQQLDMFVEAFRENGIDGDILEAILARKEDKVMVKSKGGEMLVTDLILEELGMTRAMQRAKAKGKFRKLLPQDSLAASVRSSVRSTSRGSKRT